MGMAPRDAAPTLPPGPAAPALIQTMRLVGDSVTYLRRCRDRFGPRFTLRILGYGPVVHLSRPADLKAMFTADPDDAWAGEANHRLFGAIAGRGTMFTMDGAAHLRRRRLLLPPFHGERMQHYAEVMQEVTTRVMKDCPQGRPFPLHPTLQRIALEVILAAVFGISIDRHGEEAAALRDLLARAANDGVGSRLLLFPALQWNLGPLSPWGRIVALMRRCHAAVDREIERRQALPADEAGQDVLSLLLSARDEDGQPLPVPALRDELMVLLMAGHETTGTTLAWAFERILSSPDVLTRVQAELATAGGDGPADQHAFARDAFDQDAFGRMPYLDAVVKESIRLRPIMPTAGARLLKAPLALDGLTVPAGAYVVNSEILLHSDPELYPDPDAFRPERFLNRKTDPYEWTPFGGGVRRCIGMAFALYEMKIVLATILRRTPLRLAAPPIARGRRGFFIAPADGMMVVKEAGSGHKQA